MKKKYYKISGWTLGFLFLFNFACKKMDATYVDFLKDGETVYTSKADSLVVKAGNGRVMLSWLLISDPKVSKYKIYWNNRKDSLEGNLNKTENIDSINVLIPNLAEGVYNFDVFQYDNLGNSSVKVQGIGRSYGAQYASSLLNRAHRSVSRKGRDLEITWMESEETIKEVRLEYVNAKGATIKKTIKSTDQITLLEEFPFGGAYTYYTVYLPEPLSLDTFSSSAVTENEVLSEVQIPKTNWKNYPLPGDTYKAEYDDWRIENLWDGFTDVSPKFFYADPNLPGLKLPNWFSLDLGEKFKLTKIRVFQLAHNEAWMFNYGAPRTFEVYGSSAPAADGSWTGWDLLGSFESKKPSGAAVGNLSAADVAVAKAGEEFLLNNSDKSYRYIRFKVLSTWGGNLNPMISELSLRGFYTMN